MLAATSATGGQASAPPSNAQGGGPTPAQTSTGIRQLDSRLRTVEHCLYQTAFLPSNCAPVVAALEADGVYKQLTAANPSDHGMGGSEGLVAAGFLRGMCHAPVPQSDARMTARQAALAILTSRLQELHPLEIGSIFPHFAVANLGGRRQGQAIVVFYTEATVSVPAEQGDLDLCGQALRAAFSAASAEPLKALSPKCFTLTEDGVEAADPGNSVQVSKLLMRLICCSGGTKPAGRAPPSAQIAVATGGKGRGRGRGRGRS